MPSALRALPLDTTPDAGPVRHGGPLVVLSALMATLTAFFAAGLCLQYDRPTLVAPALVVFGLPALWWCWCARQAFRAHASLPRSHAVLTGALGFDVICTCRGIAPAVFFHPDKGASGADLRLFVFLENYTSRQRVVEVRIGPHPGLGLPVVQSVRLHLAAGQATTYRWPLRAEPSLVAGMHDLPVVLRVRLPQGVGQWLPGARYHLYDIWHTRLAVPFALEPAAAAPSTGPLTPPAYVTLATLGDNAPHLERLESIITPA
ncbi:MAG: hypothetical protein ABII82_00525 [Verrucomicrobiota bacterium]